MFVPLPRFNVIMHGDASLKASKEGAKKDMPSNSALFNVKSADLTKVVVQKSRPAATRCAFFGAQPLAEVGG